ncbi:class I fructose-bisphosphate aldolase [Roseateles sp.]|uniref:class I fructose-bisphosphate aldolase n=1 Tax=Roseateles sp. TaxID=1971397 RepID=UPI003262F6B7
MNTLALIKTAQALVANRKGLLAMDESNGTCNLRFAAVGIAQTVEMRREWRELLLTAPGLSDCISGVILYDETLRQSKPDGTPFVQVAHDAGLMIGIKVDTGAKALAGRPDEKVTEGLDGLRERLQAYAALGAQFAKWRGVFAVDDGHLPSGACIEANTHALGRYAALCQEAGLVPIIEPEVLMDGSHTQARCQAVTEAVLRGVFEQLTRQGVALEALILKPNMVVAGLECAAQNTAAEVAQATLQCLRRAVPAAVPGVMFLSGGQSGELASSRLNAMHAVHVAADRREGPSPPWPLSFSFARALQHPALGIWSGQSANRVAAQQALLKRARCNRAALLGDYSAAMERS